MQVFDDRFQAVRMELTQLALSYHPSIAFPVVSDALYLCSEMIVSFYFILCVSVCFRLFFVMI